MMDPRVLFLSTALLAGLGTPLPGQQDILSPFRNPQESVPIPERLSEVFRQLRIMQSTAENIGPVSFDELGREVCDSPRWKDAYEELRGYYVDPGFLSQVIRYSGSPQDRDVALYGSYFVDNPDYVLDLIEHIPGEPVQRLREKAYARAINYLRVHLPRTFGDLSEEEYAALGLPQVGSPAAKAMGLVRDPRTDDSLYLLDLRPFVQLMEKDSESVHAQGLWFVKECFWIERRLAADWMERMTPRLRLFMMSENELVRRESFGVIEAADPKERPAPPLDSDPKDARAWLDAVLYEIYPPIRVIAEGLIDLYPSPDLDEVIEVGTALLSRDSIGLIENGRTSDGKPYRGLHVARIPEPLDKLGIPRGSVIININGQPVSGSMRILEIIRTDLEHRLQFLVEYVHDGQLRAIAYRVRK